PTFGMERVFLAIICNAYDYDKKRENIVLKLPASLAPIKAAVFPLIKDAKIEKVARDIFNELKKEFNVSYDESCSVGRRYARNDEAGTPYCITVDEESLKKKTITIRNRDDTKQIKVKINDLKEIIRKLINEEMKFENAGKEVDTRKK
ncbi:MAG: glycine--tRNA ligase, partial [Nanoarchaeota archaeon]|nr:glycine--tRNA ligase [Nanoarchaeota archaeon]